MFEEGSKVTITENIIGGEQETSYGWTVIKCTKNGLLKVQRKNGETEIKVLNMHSLMFHSAKLAS